MIIILTEKNTDVTNFYFGVLKESAENLTEIVHMVSDIGCLVADKRNDIVIVGSSINAVRLFVKGYRHVAVWFQGVGPEESFIRNHSYIRKIVLELIEKYALRHAVFSLFVSHAMKRHYETKYHIRFKKRYAVMPCFNTELKKDSFLFPGKYEKNIFAYAGRLTIWQGFDKILKVYEEIESLGLPNTRLLVLTPEKDEALDQIKKTSIKNYEVDSATADEIPEKLSKAKYGFIIRENVAVNRVATPTKLSTYIANGLIPIYSACIEDFHEAMGKLKYKLVYDEHFTDHLKELAGENIKASDIYDEFLTIYEDYYNKGKYINKITEIMKDVCDSI